MWQVVTTALCNASFKKKEHEKEAHKDRDEMTMKGRIDRH